MDNGISKKIKALKIAGTIIYAIVTIILVSVLVASIPKDGGLDVLGYVLVVIVYCLIALVAYIAPMVIGIVGIVLTKRHVSGEKQKANMTYFILMVALPIFTDGLCICTLFLL
ncbi:MAG: hypothetical protein E7596_02085 [Ruminococcaceae bacterium]|nr:hypothetical protein [Oscillospiraceae bacterium]